MIDCVNFIIGVDTPANHRVRCGPRALDREIRTHTGSKRAKRAAHNLVRKILAQSGDIDPTVPGFLSIDLDPMATKRETHAVAELCEHLTETRTRYPGTELVLRYAIKERLWVDLNYLDQPTHVHRSLNTNGEIIAEYLWPPEGTGYVGNNGNTTLLRKGGKYA